MSDLTFEKVLAVFSTWCADCKSTVKNTVQIERTWICFLDTVSPSSYQFFDKEIVLICPDCYARWLRKEKPYKK